MNFESIPKISDTGWVLRGTSIVIRGIEDYERTIKFPNKLDKKTFAIVLDHLKHNNPGTLPIGYLRNPQNKGEYKFFVTFDCSD